MSISLRLAYFARGVASFASYSRALFGQNEIVAGSRETRRSWATGSNNRELVGKAGSSDCRSIWSPKRSLANPRNVPKCEGRVKEKLSNERKMTVNVPDRFKAANAFWIGLGKIGLTPAAVLGQARVPVTVYDGKKNLVTTAQFFALWRAVGELSSDAAAGL